jgi:hypothetical protein
MLLKFVRLGFCVFVLLSAPELEVKENLIPFLRDAFKRMARGCEGVFFLGDFARLMPCYYMC